MHIRLAFLTLIMGGGYLNAQVTWTEGDYFPHFATPDSVYLIPVTCPIGQGGGAWESDWRVDSSPDIMHALTLAAMQGIIIVTSRESFSSGETQPDIMAMT